MTGRTILAFTLILTAVIGAGAGRPESDSSPPASATPAESKTLGVEELMKAVDQHRGVVWVEGVVSAVSAERKTLALIDLKEFKHCGVVTCAPYTLPVRWSGRLPSVRDQVLIEGRVEEIDGKLVFVAKQVQKAKEEADEKK